jgi:cell division protein FtsB
MSDHANIQISAATVMAEVIEALQRIKNTEFLLYCFRSVKYNYESLLNRLEDKEKEIALLVASMNAQEESIKNLTDAYNECKKDYLEIKKYIDTFPLCLKE